MSRTAAKLASRLLAVSLLLLCLSATALAAYAPGEVLVRFRAQTSQAAVASHHASLGARVAATQPAPGVQRVSLPAGLSVKDAVRRYRAMPEVELAQPNYVYHKAVSYEGGFSGTSASTPVVSGAAALLWARHPTLQYNDVKNDLLDNVDGFGYPVLSGGRLNIASAIAAADGSAISGTTTPNDPYYSNQWHLPQIGAPQAWTRITDASSVIVAVADTGVDYNQPDLTANMWGGNTHHGWNFVNDTNDPMDDDTGTPSLGTYHGTHVAGIIGAVGNNATGVSGVCWRVQLMAVKVLDNTGSGLDSDIIAGIYWAVDHGAKIINMSMQSDVGQAEDPLEATAIDYARQHDVLVVCAAGNDGVNVDVSGNAVYPGSLSLSEANVINVANSDEYDSLQDGGGQYYGNYGPQSVSLAAPGEDIWTTTKDPNETTSSSGGGHGGGCFIATAAYGTPLARQVRVLCAFRDRWLVGNALGRPLVAAYYRLGPAPATYIREHPWLPPLVRAAIRPSLPLARAALDWPGLTLASLLGGFGLAAWRVPRRRPRSR